MTAFPAITHVAVTVRDLDVSVPWYTALFGAEPVLDQDTGPFRHVVWSVGSTCTVAWVTRCRSLRSSRAWSRTPCMSDPGRTCRCALTASIPELMVHT